MISYYALKYANLESANHWCSGFELGFPLVPSSDVQIIMPLWTEKQECKESINV